MHQRRWGDQTRPPDPINTEGPDNRSPKNHQSRATAGPTKRSNEKVSPALAAMQVPDPSCGVGDILLHPQKANGPLGLDGTRVSSPAWRAARLYRHDAVVVTTKNKSRLEFFSGISKTASQSAGGVRNENHSTFTHP